MQLLQLLVALLARLSPRLAAAAMKASNSASTGVAGAMTWMQTWAAKHPMIADALKAMGAVDLYVWLKDAFEENARNAKETLIRQPVIDAENELIEFFNDCMASGMEWAKTMGVAQARAINNALGLVKGDALYLETTTPDTLLAWIDKQIKDGIAKGGNAIINGRTIQGLRSGNIATSGFAARGGMTAEAQNWNKLQTERANLVLHSIGEKRAKARLANRMRQAKYRSTHKRKTVWVKKK